MNTVESFLGQRLDELLESVAAETPAPGGGSIAALVAALAAALVAMAARFSRKHWADAAAVAERADAIRHRTAPLAPADAQAYEEVLVAMRLPKDLEPDVRNATIGGALARAADVPLEIAREASEVAALAALVAENGNPNLRGDAVAAAMFAAAATKAAARLVEVNLGTTAADGRRVKAREHAAGAEASVERALAAGL